MVSCHFWAILVRDAQSDPVTATRRMPGQVGSQVVVVDQADVGFLPPAPSIGQVPHHAGKGIHRGARSASVLTHSMSQSWALRRVSERPVGSLEPVSWARRCRSMLSPW
jgi:hypothetical protein